MKSKKATKRNGRFFCSNECFLIFQDVRIEVICKNCSKQFKKRQSEIKKSPNHFCCKSCAATFNNKNKSYATRRSKVEVYIENELRQKHPELHLMCNSKAAIGSELDFYFPNLKLAIQINGIYHYEPIHGSKKLQRIQALDQEKKR